ncbi:hypothetical protein [Deinococcus sp. YIM 77859]|uniref:hypothetical protein n=1 Tax=Deinococcus sp. YIM 77859 TaxID=1540221 RepID=UPI000556DD3F|nr:hypothetical protein [Deinococcus sp. YIM 77859]
MSCPECAQHNEPGAFTCRACGAVLAALPPGTKLALRYRTERALARDEASITYLAFDEDRQEAVILREFLPPRFRRVGTLVVPDEHEGFARERERFWHVAEAWRDEPHEGRQRVLDAFEQHGTAYAALDTHSGVPLARVLRAQALEPAAGLALVRSLAGALAFAHGKGEVDGALAPERVLVRDGAYTLTPPWPGLTAPERFQAPEVLGGRPITSSGDVYALGALALFALTRRPPPTAVERALGEALPSLPTGTPDLLTRAVTRALALRPDERPRDGAALLALFTSAAAAPVTPSSRTVRAHSGPVLGVAVNPRGEIVTIGADLRACRWSPRLEPLDSSSFTRGRPTSVQAAGERFVLTDSGGGVMVWGDVTRTAAAPEGIHQLVVLPGAARALAWTAANTLALWDLEALRSLGQTRPLPHWITGLAASVQRWGAYVGTADGGLWWLDAHSGDLERLATLGGVPRALVALPDDTPVAAQGRRLQALGGASWSLPDSVTALTASSDGRTVLAVSAGGELVEVRASGPRVAAQMNTRPTALALTPSGTHAVVGTDTGVLCVLECS